MDVAEIRERIASHNMTDAEYTRNLLAALVEVEKLRVERDEAQRLIERMVEDARGINNAWRQERERAEQAEGLARGLAEAARYECEHLGGSEGLLNAVARYDEAQC